MIKTNRKMEQTNSVVFEITTITTLKREKKELLWLRRNTVYNYVPLVLGTVGGGWENEL